MLKNNRLTLWSQARTLMLCALCLLSQAASSEQGRAISAEAEELLRASTSFLASRQQFVVDTQSTIEAVLQSGQKIQFDHSARLSVSRPDRFRAERMGDLIEQVFIYDGRTLSLLNPEDRYYATVDAPATLEKALDLAREKLDILAPAGDLVYRNAFEILMEDVTEGFVVGTSAVDGVRCHHLAFRSPHADWQIWVEKGDQPLPRKLVITTRDVAQAPQFAVRMTDWNLAPTFTPETFSFTPPADAQEIEFLVLEADGGAR